MDAASLLADPGLFEEVLEGTLNSDEGTRKKATEILLEVLDKQTDATVRCLISCVRTSAKPYLKRTAVVHLRRVLDNVAKDDSGWKKLTPDTQNYTKTELLAGISDQGNERSLRKIIVEIVANLATELLDINSWPELLPFIFQCVQSQLVHLQEAALLIFGMIVENDLRIMLPYLEQIHGILGSTLGSAELGKPISNAQCAALQATSTFVQAMETAQQRDAFQDLLMPMLRVLIAALGQSQEDEAETALELFVDMAGSQPRFFRNNLEETCTAMLQIIQMETVDENIRHMAVEFIVTLIEAKEKAPGMMRKVPQVLNNLLHVLFTLLLDIDEDEDWRNAVDEENEDAGEGQSFEIAKEGLDRIAQALPPKSFLPLVMPILQAHLSDGDWRKRHGALMALSMIAEGCAKPLKGHLNELAQVIVQGASDNHYRVRFAAINALGQLSTDLADEWQEQQHSTLVPILLKSMEDSENRVKGHATSALINFCEGCPEDIIVQYLDSVISKLLTLLQSNSTKLILETALQALASVADCAEEQFKKYYNTVIPLLKHILEAATSDEQRMIRAKALECVSLVGMAVGKEQFRDDAKAVMQLLMTLDQEQTKADDPTMSFKLQAWARICKTLGQEFVLYMGHLMPLLLQVASAKPDIRVTQVLGDDDSEDEGSEDGYFSSVVDGKRITMRTSLLEEKSSACITLGCFAQELREHFAPYIESVAEIMIPLVKFNLHDETRCAAIECLPYLLHAARVAKEKGIPEAAQLDIQLMANTLLQQLMESFENEDEIELLLVLLEGLDKLLTEAVAGKLLTAGTENMNQFSQLTDGVMMDYWKRREERQSRTQTEYFDQEEEEQLAEEADEDAQVFESVTECISTISKYFGREAMPLLQSFVEKHIVRVFRDSSSSVEERRIALGLLDDLTEHTSKLGAVDGVSQFFHALMPLSIQFSTHKNADLRQAALFGIGVCAQYGGEDFAPSCMNAVVKLRDVIMAKDSRARENEYATDNAIASLGRILVFQEKVLGDQLNSIMTAWLNCLPIKADRLEAKWVHGKLIAMVQANHEAVIGPNRENLAILANLFREILSENNARNLITKEDKPRAEAIINELKQMGL